MKNIYISFFLIICFFTPLQAKVFIKPIEAMKENYPTSTQIIREKKALSSATIKKLQKDAHTKLSSKNYEIYQAKKENQTLGYGILINKKVRSKNAVVLYFIAKDELLGIEIIAFNEPLEYLPNKAWQEKFKDKKTDTMLQLGKDIPTITGATLSAKSVLDGSRIAFALYNELIKGK